MKRLILYFTCVKLAAWRGEAACFQLADRTCMAYFLYVLGMVFIIEGLPYFSFPLFMQEMLKKIPELSQGQLRFYGFLLMMVGLGIIIVTHFWGLT